MRPVRVRRLGHLVDAIEDEAGLYKAGARPPALLLGGEWQQRAACRGHPGDFVPNAEPERVPDWVAALCGNCPVRAPCLAAATESRAVGFWAGTVTRQRRGG